MTIATILLCAGESKRLGTPKQFVRLNGRTLLHKSCELALAFSSYAKSPWAPLVVSGPYCLQDAAEMPSEQVEQVINMDWQRGMHTSLALGIKQRANAEAVLVLLVDQYRIELPDLIALFTRHQTDPTRPAAAAFDGTLGPPVIWPAKYHDALLSQSVNSKRLLLNANPLRLPLSHAKHDIDTHEDVLQATAT